MKKHNLLFAISIAFVIGCSSDSESAGETNLSSPLLGKWKLKSIQILDESIPLSECQQEQSIEFLTSNLGENYFIDNEPCLLNSETFNYHRVGTNLIISENNNTITTTTKIINLTESHLKIKYISDNKIGNYPTNQQEIKTYIKTNE